MHHRIERGREREHGREREPVVEARFEVERVADLDLALTVPRPGRAGARKRPPEQGECGLLKLAFDRQEDHPYGEA